jgi:hypothetical protein
MPYRPRENRTGEIESGDEGLAEIAQVRGCNSSVEQWQSAERTSLYWPISGSHLC